MQEGAWRAGRRQFCVGRQRYELGGCLAPKGARLTSRPTVVPREVVWESRSDLSLC